MYKSIVKPFLFLFNPEKAHHLSTGILNFIRKIPGIGSMISAIYAPSNSITTVAGLKFKNPLGLAAGFDKDGQYIEAMALLGFGFIEVGTVTPLPQSGNPKPRLFRLTEDRAIINRMGFNNEGVDALVERLKHMTLKNVIIGGNIGKNKQTPNENAVDDYVICFNKLHDHVDYFVVNVSSPNTPNLRKLQEADALNLILSSLQKINHSKSIQRPIFLKIAPDLTWTQLDEIIEVVSKNKIAGVIATNTTIDRSGLHTEMTTVEAIGNGGLSGAPLQKRSPEVVAYLRKGLNKDYAIIGVGGIDSVSTAKAMKNAGADLIQIFSGMIYEGPGLVKRIVQGL